MSLMIYNDDKTICPSRENVIRHRFISIICLAIFFMLSLPAEGSAAKIKKILVLHSYHQGLVWTDDIMEGIYSVFNKYDPDIDINVEYMDTKRHFDDHVGEYLTGLRDIYKIKYGGMKLDMIIASDDNAFQFLLLHHNDLFPGTPIVFCGVNNFENKMLTGHEHINGVIEFLDQKASLDIALKLHPDTEEMAIITETSSSGSVNRTILEVMADEYKDRVKFIFLDKDNTGLTLQELLDKLRQLPKKSIVYYSDFLRSRGKYIIQETAVPQISRASNRPIYTHYDEIMGLGVVGGKLVSGKSHGRKAAEMAADILRGAPMSSLPVYKESINAYTFDYQQLKRFGIDEKDLPEGSEVINTPFSFYSKYKHLVWAASTMFSFLVISLIAISMNVRKRKKLEEELRNSYNTLEQKVEERTRDLSIANIALKSSEEKYHDLFESATDAIFILDLEGNFINVNSIAYTRLGYTKEEMLSMHVSKLDPPEFAPKVPARMAEIREKGIAIFESAHIRKDGTVMPVEINARMYEYSGKKVYLSFIRDISMRKKVENALRMSEKRLSRAEAIAHLGNWEWDIPARTLAWSKEVYRLYGMDQEKDHPHYDIVIDTLSPESRDAFIKAVEDALTYAKPFEGEYSLILPDGTRKFTHTMGEVSCDAEGRPLKMFGIVQDITGRKIMENQIRASLEEKEVLLREIHHRVKNNMTVISSMLALHSRLIKSDQDRQMLDEARTRIKAMAIIHEKLYQSGDMSKINASDYLRDILKEISSSYAVNNGRIVVRTDIQDITLSIDDAMPFGLIINELVTNAMKHAFPELRQGEIKVNISLNGTNEVSLSVSDNGVGVPDDIESRKSASLGLSLVDALVRQVRGELKLHKDNGTRFHITFPRRQS